MTDSNLEPVKEENIVECRACLQEINSDSTYYNLFDCVGQQEQMGSTIAEKLSNIAHIEISDADELPKVICDMCCTLLQSAHSFAVTVRKTDELLRQKFANVQKESEIVWPKPIQISNNIDTHYIPHADIKEEVLSEDECFAKQDSDEHNISKVEIKVESNSQDRELNIPIDNEECRLDNMQIEYLESVNDESVEPKENTAIKEEPISDEEMETVESLDCMLCTKTFNSVSGLKAHVITQHSYKGVKRKSNNTVSPKKVKYTYVCEICKRAFATSTDLMVHETCHDKCKCYLCHKSFPTFRDLSQHRLTCCESKTPETYLQKPESSKDAPKPTKPTTDALKPRTTELTNSRTTETTKQKKFTKYSPKPKITTEASESSDTDTSEPRKYVYSQKRKSTKEALISPNTTELTIPNNTMESQLQIRQRDTPVKQEEKKSKKRRSLEINIRISH
ncbi:uncharacterized protein LOC121729747 isoform X2 [Aricia agestis]|uniref:uncharacterized protein LOC121729747 isoform X2 n=1 Tax=Aricia agestis TaxID=91739 RepID=UPI001C202630|nr:uncharacterized protein LOC121729747 isoform X2 [Aricia agestis]